MKMKDTKFIAIATTLGLGTSLLAGCSASSGVKNYDEDEDDDRRNSAVYSGSHSSSSSVVPVVGSSKSKGSHMSSGSKGIGSAKSGGAGS